MVNWGHQVGDGQHGECLHGITSWWQAGAALEAGSRDLAVVFRGLHLEDIGDYAVY